ncbi:MAG: DUF6644 family protein [Gemmatimonadota bacterium]
MLFPFFEWLEATAVGSALAQSLWAFPLIEAAHLVGLTLLGGTLLVGDLRLLGLGLTNQSIAEVAENMHRWMVGAVVFMLTTGLLLFISEPIKLYFSTSFLVKMITLPIALIFTFTVRRRIVRAGTADTTMKTRLVGAASLLLWFTVAAAGRWIGFS